MSGTDKVISKIQKLLAMAEDTSSPNEAMIAAKKARILMDKHGLSKTDIENAVGDQFLETKADRKTKTIQTWLKNLVVAVAELNDCRPVLQSGGIVALYKFQGFKADAVVAKLTMDYLTEACERACALSCAHGRSEKNFFRLGFVKAIGDKVDEIVEQRKTTVVDQQTGTSLIPVKAAMIEAHFGGLKNRAPSNVRMPDENEQDAYFEGIKHGKRTGLEKQVHGCEIAKLA